MNAEAHRRAIRESIEMIEECVQVGAGERQRTIGFHCSVAASDILELYLHSQNLIGPGTAIKHEFFASERKANERLPFDFSSKNAIIKLMIEIESKRNALCYGRPQPAEAIAEVIRTFNKLRKLFDSIGVKYE